jgi:hypothetical protein
LAALAALAGRLARLERSPQAAAAALALEHPALAALVKSSSPYFQRKERSCQFLL